MGMRIDGLLIVDKPEGITSLDVVREVKRRFTVRKAGHIGTLDPFATGVLPLAINEGTKLVPFLKENPKVYEAMMELGEETETDDATGRVTHIRSIAGVTPQMIQAVFQTFSGRIRQIPPMYSAVKVKGRPLYQLARKGIEVERKEREVEIYHIHLDEIDLPRVCFTVSCSKGTYIRALARDVGRKIGCGAHLCLLRRIRSGPFHIGQAVPWERLKGLSTTAHLYPWLISLKEALPAMPEVVGDRKLVEKVRFGKEMMACDLFPNHRPAFEQGGWLKMSSPDGGLVAILKSEVREAEIEPPDPGKVILRPLRVFQPNR
jgi:tRNA pseudouridine55 synthase